MNDNDQSGFSVVELLIALTLLAFLGTSLLTVISAGGDAFQRVLDEKSAQSEARIALSYITVKLRQNSSKNNVGIVASDSPVNDGSVLKIGATAGAAGSVAGGVGAVGNAGAAGSAAGYADGVGIGAADGFGNGRSCFIYFVESPDGGPGSLMEKNSETPRVDDPAGAYKIADIAGFDVSYADETRSLLSVSISYDSPNGRMTRSVLITLRA